MPSAIESASVSKSSLWAGRIVSTIVVLLMIFDGVTKVVKAPQAIQATVQIGFPENTVAGIGAALLVCTLLYAIPATSVFGAVLLTGYLGGAVAANVRADSPVLNTVLAIALGVLVWLGLYLRESRLHTLLPLRG
jgi:hypothetical protein